MALRKALRLTQDALAKRSGILRREEIAKLETGSLKAGSYRVVAALAQGFGLPVTTCHEYLEGDLSVEQALEKRLD